MTEFYRQFDAVDNEFYQTLEDMFDYKQSALFLSFQDSGDIKVLERSFRSDRQRNPESEYLISNNPDSKVYNRVAGISTRLNELSFDELAESIAKVSNLGRRAIEFAYPEESQQKKSLKIFRHFNESALGFWTPAASHIGSNVLRVSQNIGNEVITKELTQPRMNYFEHEQALAYIHEAHKGLIALDTSIEDLYIEQLHADTWYGFPDSTYIRSTTRYNQIDGQFEVIIQTEKAESNSQKTKSIDIIKKALIKQLPDQLARQS